MIDLPFPTVPAAAVPVEAGEWAVLRHVRGVWEPVARTNVRSAARKHLDTVSGREPHAAFRLAVLVDGGWVAQPLEFPAAAEPGIDPAQE